MNKIIVSTTTLMIMSITTYGGGVIVPNIDDVNEAFTNLRVFANYSF